MKDERLQPEDSIRYLVDRLAVVACVVDDCAELTANGETVPEEVWTRLRLVTMCIENDLSIWRRLPYYERARTQIRSAILDIHDQLR